MKRLVTVLLIFFCVTRVIAQTAPDVTLVTTGMAPTEREATLVALRSAIEQAYGVFVSANTEILDDELVKDEVVSISRGNIKQYVVNSRTDMPNGQVAVTVTSEVSVSSLITYAKGKGSSAEFAGESFAMNVKLMNLKEQNTLKAYQDMCKQVSILLDNAFDYQVKIADPVVTNTIRKYSQSQKYFEGVYKVNGQIIVENNEVNYQIYKLVDKTLASLSLTNTEIQQYLKMGKKWDLLSFSYLYGMDFYENMVELADFIQDKNFYTLPIPYKELCKEDKRILDKLFQSYFNYTVYINREPLPWSYTPPMYFWGSEGCQIYGHLSSDSEGVSEVQYLTWKGASLLAYACEYYHRNWGGMKTMEHSAGQSLWDVIRPWVSTIKRIRKSMVFDENAMENVKQIKKMNKEWESLQQKMSRYRQEKNIQFFDIEQMSKFLLTLPLGLYEKLVKYFAPRGVVFEFTENGARQLAACFPLHEVKEEYNADVLSSQAAMCQEFSLYFINEDEISDFSGIEIKHN